MNWKKIAALAAALTVPTLYWQRKNLVAQWMDIPPPSNRVRVRRNLQVPAGDGVHLATDHYAPQRSADHGDSFPTILIRTPYGKALAPVFHARRFAEQGYHVLVQDVRGRFGSGGEFEPFVNETGDGAATVAWLKQQPWFNGVLGTWGQSYLAYTQWALAMAKPHSVTAMFPSLPSARGPFIGQTGQAQLLELPLRWMVVLDALRYMPGGKGAFAPWRAVWLLTPQGQDRALARAFAHMPLKECDELAIGRQIPYFRQLMGGSTPPQWQQSDFRGSIGELTQPIHLLGGWYDFMLGDMLHDYAELQDAGRAPFLTIGPWHHIHPEIRRVTLQEGLAWFDAHLKRKPQRLRRKPVRVFVMGSGEWREFDSWPPPARYTSFYLKQQNRLALGTPTENVASDSYVYDPHDPTPAVGGALFFSGAGPRDNRELEARLDVITYTTDPLSSAVEVIGPVKVVLFVSSSRPSADFFVRLCDVHPNGRSINVCDGIYRILPGQEHILEDGVMEIEISMLATAHRFQKGHAVRLQVSSGAHPRFARNPGKLDPVPEAGRMYVAQQMIHHGSRYPSALILPLL